VSANVVDPIVDIRGLRKSYGQLEAVRGVDMRISRGEIFALLGPNGAGKTSIVEILEGYRPRDAGEVSVLGFDPARGETALKARIGIVLQSSSGESYLSAREAVDMYAGYYPAPRDVDELLELVGLGAQAGMRINKLSGGQRRRLDLAIALSGDPELLFLDEPTTGFDPSARRSAWNMIRELAHLGKTVMLTTHYMDEATALADRLAVLVDGTIVAEGTPDAVISAHAHATTIRLRWPAGSPDPPPDLGLVAEPNAPGYLAVTSSHPTELLHRLTGWAVDAGTELEDLSVSRPSLEDVYLELTGRPQDEDVSAADGT
jgi:ABC-2 type transport system ATP-binding protein